MLEFVILKHYFYKCNCSHKNNNLYGNFNLGNMKTVGKGYLFHVATSITHLNQTSFLEDCYLEYKQYCEASCTWGSHSCIVHVSKLTHTQFSRPSHGCLSHAFIMNYVLFLVIFMLDTRNRIVNFFRWLSTLCLFAPISF